MDPIEIEVEQVTFTYEDGVKALTELNCCARAGEFLVVLGANGAGKSTLCFLLSGIVPHIYGGQRTGKLLVAGQDPWDQPLFVTAKSTGVLLQDPEIGCHKTLLEIMAENLAHFALPLERDSQITVFDFLQIIRDLE
mgnify:CR=1 FL=1